MSKCLWVIKFDSKDQEKADLYIPAPPSFGTEWMKTLPPEELNDDQALECLTQIQEICEKITQDCHDLSPEEMTEIGDYLNMAGEANQKLTDLQALFKKFNDFLKKLNYPPYSKPPEGNEKL